MFLSDGSNENKRKVWEVEKVLKHELRWREMEAIGKIAVYLNMRFNGTV